MSELSMSVRCMSFNSGHLSHDSLIEGEFDLGIRLRFAFRSRILSNEGIQRYYDEQSHLNSSQISR